MPLHDYHPYILCDDNSMAFNWMISGDSTVRKTIIDKINEKSKHQFKHKFFYRDGYISFLNENKETKHLLFVRGWGHLIGSGGHNLPPKEAARIQDEFAEYIVEQLNK
jgi:hypothetical protein